MSINLFRKQSIAEVSARLNVHPFDVARYFGQKEGGLPSELLFEESEVVEIQRGMRIEFWWSRDLVLPDGNREYELIRALLAKILETQLEEPTRRDNLCRGLVGNDHRFVQRVVNALIMMEVLQSIATSDGVDVQLTDGVVGQLQQIVEGGELPPELQSLIS